MRVMAINGSPRKTWNTATLLEHALAGAAEQGASTEMVHLYDLSYKGCKSCFACKLPQGKSYAQCAVDDALGPVLRRITACDALILGSPIYYGHVTGEMRSFLERLLFPLLRYDAQYRSLRKRDVPTAMVYTMNVDEAGAEAGNYPLVLGAMEAAVQRTLSGTPVRSLYVTDTYQFDDYEKYEITAFDGAHKAARRREIFPEDCRKARQLGASLVQPASA